MGTHVCPWWGGYFIDNRLRRWIHNPTKILAPHVKHSQTVLDFGCGMGLFSIATAQLVGSEGKVLAVDLQQKMLDVLTKRATSAGVIDRIQTYLCDADALNLEQPIDFALAFYCVHEVPNARRLLDEVHSLLPKGGQFLIAEPVGHVTRRCFQQTLDAAEQVGFELARPAKDPLESHGVT